MERKFKLIKPYPGNNNQGTVYQADSTGMVPTINCLGKTISPLSWPVHFEEVLEKEFTIVDMEIIAGEVVFNGFNDKEDFVRKLKQEAINYKTRKDDTKR